MGVAGETLAAWFLTEHGVAVLGRNVKVDGGEVDLLAIDGHSRVVIEVRTRTNAEDPIDAVGHGKRRQVATLGRRIGASRIDLVGIGLGRRHFDVHWVPDAL